MPARGSRLVADGTKLSSPMTGVCLPSAIVENMAEFRPEMCTEAAQQGLLQWLLKRLKVSLALWEGRSDFSAVSLAHAGSLALIVIFRLV